MSIRITRFFATFKKQSHTEPDLRRIAHDLNNLMMTVDGYSGFLKEDLHDRPELQQYADKISEAALQAGRIIRELESHSEAGHSEGEGDCLDFKDSLHGT